MDIRDALAGDAAAASEVIRRSISALCLADHEGDEAILSRWLNNKTPDIVASWIAQPRGSFLLAVEDGAILGVGAVTDAGEITLNYVSPEVRFRGVSRALLAALEARARAKGNVRCHLLSTETARRFYRAEGYVETGQPEHKFGSRGGYPMSKALEQAAPLDVGALWAKLDTMGGRDFFPDGLPEDPPVEPDPRKFFDE